MKKIIRLFSIPLLLLFSLVAYADITATQVLGLCNLVPYPVPNQDVAVSTTGEITAIQYKTTDPSGYIYLNSDYHGKMIRVYLAAGKRSVNADCGSRLTPTSSGQVILGVPGSLCPSFCPKDKNN